MILEEERSGIFDVPVFEGMPQWTTYVWWSLVLGAWAACCWLIAEAVRRALAARAARKTWETAGYWVEAVESAEDPTHEEIIALDKIREEVPQ